MNSISIMGSPEHLLKLKIEVKDELIADLKKIKINNEYLTNIEAQTKVEKLILWLSKSPKNVIFRVNTILCQPQFAQKAIENELKKNSSFIPAISIFSQIPEMIVVNNWHGVKELDFKKQSAEIIVDAICGAAILRGANIYAPGVLAMPKNLKLGDKVSVYVDVNQICKKGLLKQFEGEKFFVGNGIIQLTREEIFTPNIQTISGIAVTMTDVISYIPQLNNNFLPNGFILLQNLPSIITSRIVDPEPSENILDMCAAPGNKTTHLSALMENKGVLMALEKNKNKVEKMILNLKTFSVKNVKLFCFDSTKAACDIKKKSVLDGPPFNSEVFDRILLDGPCSGLGQRPQINNNISVSQLRSYVSLQRKLFSTAIKLLKSGGTLVYSTCTVTVAENEGIVAWALKTFPNIELQPLNEKLNDLKLSQFTSVGYSIDGLSVDQSDRLCRFDSKGDSIGFFIACFLKK